MSDGSRNWLHDYWPAAPQSAWHAACAVGDGLEQGGRASHLAPRTRLNTELAFGRYLAFVRRRGLLSEANSVEDYFELSSIRAFIVEELAQLAPQTRLLILSALHRAFGVMAPELNTQTLKLVLNRFHRIARAESERSRTLNSKEAGQQLDDCGQPVKAC
jgi:hypothetical protein